MITAPNPIFIITTLKENGKTNANLHSWGLLLGSGNEFWSILTVMKHQHTFGNIMREKEWCLNYPSYDDFPKAFETIYKNDTNNDEILDSGFSLEESKVVKTPRIAECMINIECQMKWERDMYEGSQWHIFGGRVVNVAMADAAIIPDPVERIEKMKLMYNIRSTIDPLTGDFYGPNTLGVLGKVDKIFNDDGSPKDWKRK